MHNLVVLLHAFFGESSKIRAYVLPQRVLETVTGLCISPLSRFAVTYECDPPLVSSSSAVVLRFSMVCTRAAASAGTASTDGIALWGQGGSVGPGMVCGGQGGSEGVRERL